MATQKSTARSVSPKIPSSPAADASLLNRAIALVAEHPDYASAFAALLHIDVKAAGAPATSQSSPVIPPTHGAAPVSRPGELFAGTQPGMLQSPAAGLYRPGYCESNSDAELPFMQTPGTGEEFTYPGSTLPLRMRSCWVEPDFGDGKEAFGLAVAFGKRAAAAYFLNLQSGDTRVPLHEVMADMFADPDNASGAGVAFCGYLVRLMWLYGQYLSPAQVSADVEAVILEDATRNAEDEADMQGDR